MSDLECSAGWGGYPDDPCPHNESMVSQDTDLVMHVGAHSCVRSDNDLDHLHVCSCGSQS